jgi:hypothetical protein
MTIDRALREMSTFIIVDALASPIKQECGDINDGRIAWIASTVTGGEC